MVFSLSPSVRGLQQFPLPITGISWRIYYTSILLPPPPKKKYIRSKEFRNFFFFAFLDMLMGAAYINQLPNRGKIILNISPMLLRRGGGSKRQFFVAADSCDVCADVMGAISVFFFSQKKVGRLFFLVLLTTEIPFFCLPHKLTKKKK